MKIYLNEITDQGVDLDFNQTEAWVKKTVEKFDEHYPGEAPPASSGTRPISVHFTLRKVDEIVVISGKVKAEVQLLCSRCGNAFQLRCDSAFSGLYSTDPDTAGVGHLEGQGKPAGQNKGFARHAHQEEEEQDEFSSDDSETLGKELDITYLPEATIELSDVLQEQLSFQIPLQPLCKEDCKGVCANCGTDQNTGRCDCAQLSKNNSAFSALKSLKSDLNKKEKNKNGSPKEKSIP